MFCLLSKELNMFINKFSKAVSINTIEAFWIFNSQEQFFSQFLIAPVSWQIESIKTWTK